MLKVTQLRKHEENRLEALTASVERVENSIGSGHQVSAYLRYWLCFYTIKASRNRRRFYVISFLQMVFGVAVTVVPHIASEGLRWISSMLGAAVSLSTGLLLLLRCLDGWHRYRKACEQLKESTYDFLTLFLKTHCADDENSHDYIKEMIAYSTKLRSIVKEEFNDWYDVPGDRSPQDIAPTIPSPDRIPTMDAKTQDQPDCEKKAEKGT